jgi:hypothetical protein
MITILRLLVSKTIGVIIEEFLNTTSHWNMIAFHSNQLDRLEHMLVVNVLLIPAQALMIGLMSAL